MTYEGRRIAAALRALLELVDKGVLVRDISHDHESGWAMNQLPLLQALAEAKQALSEVADQFGSGDPAMRERSGGKVNLGGGPDPSGGSRNVGERQTRKERHGNP